MGIKFGRNYQLLVQQIQNNQFVNPISIGLPYRVDFDIIQSNYSSSHVAKLTIYNLAQNTRNAIRKDQIDTGNQKQVVFQAGYGTQVTASGTPTTQLATVLNANINVAYSVREMSSWKTYIEAYDGGYGFQNSFSTHAPGQGVDQLSILQNLISDLSQFGISEGQISQSFTGPIPKGQAVMGRTTDLLTELTGGAFYIYNSKVYIVTDNEFVTSTIPTISGNTGLLGTPRREQSIIAFDMLFEPGLVVGQLVNLESQEGGVNGANFNGIHKVIGLHHHGTISAATSGEAITSVTMQGNQFQGVAEALSGS